MSELASHNQPKLCLISCPLVKEQAVVLFQPVAWNKDGYVPHEALACCSFLLQQFKGTVIASYQLNLMSGFKTFTTNIRCEEIKFTDTGR